MYILYFYKKMCIYVKIILLPTNFGCACRRSWRLTFSGKVNPFCRGEVRCSKQLLQKTKQRNLCMLISALKHAAMMDSNYFEDIHPVTELRNSLLSWNYIMDRSLVFGSVFSIWNVFDRLEWPLAVPTFCSRDRGLWMSTRFVCTIHQSMRI